MHDVCLSHSFQLFVVRILSKYIRSLGLSDQTKEFLAVQLSFQGSLEDVLWVGSGLGCQQKLSSHAWRWFNCLSGFLDSLSDVFSFIIIWQRLGQT